jgi:putative transposase
VQGVSTRRVDDLVKALGLEGISKSQVSRVCAALDAEVERFRTRRLAGNSPCLWLDATFLTVRDGERVVTTAVVVAVGANADGRREVLGFDVGPSEDGVFWETFLRSLVGRGLRGVELATSDAHEGVKGAIAAVLHGASWQRCRVHFVRNALALVPKGVQALAAATIRTVFAQPTAKAARAQWAEVIKGFRERFPRVAALMEAAEADVLAYLAFPREHWRRVPSGPGAPIPWSGSTARSNGGPTWSASSRPRGP